ncbi:MAG: Na+/H+ antiporter subunit G [Oleibacter sp.]|nr:Na+/H+ antiporter subunit G [Thalassolituus sp.]
MISIPSIWVDGVVALLLLIGSGFMLIGSWGLVKLPDFFTRLHAPTKASTLGIGAVLFASLIWFSVRDGGLQIHELVISLFLFLTAPVSAYMMGKAALHRQQPNLERTRNVHLAELAAKQQSPAANDKKSDKNSDKKSAFHQTE